MEKVEDHKRCIVGGDLNGHVGVSSDTIERVHGGNYYRAGNGEGERVIDFAISNEFVICNTIYRERPEHLITYKSGNRSS